MYEYKAKLDRVVDGDTMSVTIDLGFKISTTQKIRLAYIDTPETFRVKHTSEEYKKGIAATNYVKKRLEDNQNEMKLMTYKGTGKYGRYIGVIWLKDSDVSLNDELVQKGYAKKVE